MIFILKNADFSANNIGKVDVTVLDAEVKQLMRKLTRFPASEVNVFAKAFNDFYVGLRDEGILTNLQVLSIPRMSAILSQCGINVADEGNGAEMATIYSITDGKMKKINGLAATSYRTGFFSVDLSSDDFCCFGRFFGNEAVQGCLNMAPINPDGTYSSDNVFTIQRVDTAGGFQAYYGHSIYIGQQRETIFVVNTDNALNFYSPSSATPQKIADIGAPSPISGFLPLAQHSTSSAGEQTTTIFGCGEGLSAAKAKTLVSLISAFEKVFDDNE